MAITFLFGALVSYFYIYFFAYMCACVLVLMFMFAIVLCACVLCAWYVLGVLCACVRYAWCACLWTSILIGSECALCFWCVLACCIVSVVDKHACVSGVHLELTLSNICLYVRA